MKISQQAVANVALQDSGESSVWSELEQGIRGYFFLFK